MPTIVHTTVYADTHTRPRDKCVATFTVEEKLSGRLRACSWNWIKQVLPPSSSIIYLLTFNGGTETDSSCARIYLIPRGDPARCGVSRFPFCTAVVHRRN